MTDLAPARGVEHLQRLRLRHLADRLDAVLAEAARKEPTYLAFLDRAFAHTADFLRNRPD